MATSARAGLSALERCPHGVLSFQEAATLAVDRDEVLDFSYNVNPYGPPPQVMAALSAVDVSRYPDSDCSELRAALARRLTLQESQILVGNGSIELIWLLGIAYLRPGDRVLILGPTFGEYARLARIFGAEPLELRAPASTSWEPELATVRTALREGGARLVFLCNPNNPTGQYYRRALVDGVLRLCSDSILVIDEAFLGLVDSPWRSELLLDRGPIVLVRSLTKDFALAGLRLGYAVASPETIATLEAVKPPWSVNSLAQAAGLAALNAGDFLVQSRRLIAASKAWLTKELAALGLDVVPSAANFFLMKVGDGAGFRRRLLERGCCVRDCASFGLPEYVRIGVRKQADCERLLDAVRQVLA